MSDQILPPAWTFIQHLLASRHKAVHAIGAVDSNEVPALCLLGAMNTTLLGKVVAKTITTTFQKHHSATLSWIQAPRNVQGSDTECKILQGPNLRCSL